MKAVERLKVRIRSAGRETFDSPRFCSSPTKKADPRHRHSSLVILVRIQSANTVEGFFYVGKLESTNQSGSMLKVLLHLKRAHVKHL